MNTTYFERINANISRLGFGIMRLPMLENNEINLIETEEMIDYAIENGVNYFDTAYVYHDGKSEEILCKFLSKYPRESYYLADKLPIWLCKTVEDVKRYFNEQIERCKVEYFDFYLLHSVNRATWQNIKSGNFMDELIEYKKQGKIKSLGFSFHDNLELFEEVVNYHDWDFVQIQTNYIDETFLNAKAMYEILLQKNIPCIVMEPVRGGALACLPSQATKELATATVEYSPAQWALRWCASHDGMKVILSGMSNMQQIKENVDVISNAPKMTTDEMSIIHNVRDMLLKVKTVPCTGCNYCSGCEFKVQIPSVFSAYNRHKLFDDGINTSAKYDILTKEFNADKCTQCGVCVERCPQKIDIPQEIERILKETLA